MSRTPIRVVIADPFPVVREGIVSLLAAEDDIVVIGEAGEINEALLLCRQQRAGVLLLGLVTADPVPPEIVTALQQQHPERKRPPTRVLALAAECDANCIQMLLTAGVVGCLLRDEPRQRLVAGIRAVAAGRPVFSAAVVQALVQPNTLEPDLTPRQRQVLQLAANGLTNRQIALELEISPRMVQAHSQEACARLGAGNRTEAVARALVKGLIAGPT
jgi:DNA-binding NarL/FixJ family response regulator